MEIRANYILVGLFTLLVLFGALAFTLWVASRDKDMAITEYDISVTESTKGLSVNSDVLFIGIRVGKVTAIRISHVTPGEVMVRIAIDADTPVREDSIAQLEIRGLTGGAVLAISGGTEDSPLKKVPEGHVGEIRYEPSPLSSAMMQMPEIMSGIHHTLKRLDRVLSPDNIRAFSSILHDINDVTAAFAERRQSLDSIVMQAEQAVRNFDRFIATANNTLATDVKSTAESMNRIARRVDHTLKVVEPGLKQFGTQGLAEMRVLMVEMRGLVQTLTRLTKRMENDPRRFFFGNTVKEFGK